MGIATVTVADLRPVDLFDDLDDERLAAWAAAARPRTTEPGELVAEQGGASIGLILLLDGTVQALQVTEDRADPLGLNHGPTWIGAIAALTELPVAVRMQCQTACRLAIVPQEDVLDLVLVDRPVFKRIMREVGPVYSRLTSIGQHRERLAALGTMAAGLAHELNNPAAAARRAAAELGDTLDTIGATLGEFVDAGIERADAARLVELQREAVERGAAASALDTLDAADAEDAMLERLEDLGVPEPWRLAEPLAAAGLEADWLDRVAQLAGAATGPALRWVAASLTARGLTAELQDSAERMSSLVGAVKRYAYMDRGEVVEADLHEGLETTLVVLGHKLKHRSIKVAREYDRSLPKLMIHGSELNQVWTNLLDNAIDAVADGGSITVRTVRESACARVDIADDGPGIPAEQRTHVLEPFFTTKPVGQGTGLGLDTSRRIVEERHAGTLGFDTGPDGTTFHVWLPLGPAPD